MYLPPPFTVPDPSGLHALIRAYPLATLVVGTEIAHVPLLLDGDVLVGHVARANPVWRRLPSEVTAVFSGPDAYVSPRWYRNPAEHVPTWNYAVVHVSGVLDVDPDLARSLDALVAAYEGDAWSPDPELKAELSRAIVGIRLTISRMEGKCKLSQNRSSEDREGVLEGLATRGGPRDAELLALMQRR